MGLGAVPIVPRKKKMLAAVDHFRWKISCALSSKRKYWNVLGAGLGEVADDGGVGVEEIITGHAGLTGDTSGDDNDIAAGKSLLEAVVGGNVARDLFAINGGIDNKCVSKLLR